MIAPSLLFGWLPVAAISAAHLSKDPAVDASKLRGAVTLYASFDEDVRADRGGGTLKPATRFDHPTEKGQFVFEEGIDRRAFRIAKGKGVQGGALECVDVLPRRGRIFFPAKGNLAYRPGGWGGAVSVWINTDPNTMLKTPFCDPVQITEKGAGNGGLWVDFPDSKPRDLRMGAFNGLEPGEKPIPESDPAAPLVTVKDVGFQAGDWHHLVLSWDRFDTGKDDATAALYIDGRKIGELTRREIGMRWDLERTGIYFAVNYIGLLDELALFNRPLSPAEIQFLKANPGALASQ